MTDAAVVIGVGARAGLGAALARRAGSEGLHAFVAGRTAEKLEAVAEEIRQAGGEATAVVTDCTVSSEVAALFDRIEADHGGPPRLAIYNAGNNAPRPLLEMTDEFFESVWRICAFGAFVCGREAAKRMVPAGGGSLIFTGATASIRSRPPFTAFASAKAAERAIAHGMAREFGPQGLHVAHVIVDGAIDGDRLNERLPQIKERLGKEGMLSIDAIADAFWAIHIQHPSAWTLELDVRPYKETF